MSPVFLVTKHHYTYYCIYNASKCKYPAVGMEKSRVKTQVLAFLMYVRFTYGKSAPTIVVNLLNLSYSDESNEKKLHFASDFVNLENASVSDDKSVERAVASLLDFGISESSNVSKKEPQSVIEKRK